jgi:PII-like signaling protein
MTLDGHAVRLTVLIGESDQWENRALSSEIVRRAHAAGMAGASVFRGLEGFGAGNRIHTTRVLSLSEDLPIAVVIVDTAAAIEAFLPQLDEIVRQGLVLVEDVRVVQYGSSR